MNHEIQAYSRELRKELDNLHNISEILRDDIQSLIDTYQNDFKNQTLRRALIRAIWAYIEGNVHALQCYTLRACELGGKDIPIDDRKILSESTIIVNVNGVAEIQNLWADTLTKIKKTLKISCELTGFSWRPDFNDNKWNQLCKSIQDRHRLTHPRKSNNLGVSDEELNDTLAGLEWFVITINEFQIKSCEHFGVIL